MVSGKTGFMGTQLGLAATSAMMAFPSVMVFLSLVLKPRSNRWVNICLGVVYAVIMLMTMHGAWMFYILLGIIEITLTVLIIWQAWSWLKQLSDASPAAPHDN